MTGGAPLAGVRVVDISTSYAGPTASMYLGDMGADVVLESVGGALFDACLRATAWEGRIVVIGFAGGEIPSVKAGLLLVKNISVLGLQSSDYRDREPATATGALAEVLELHRSGRMRSLVGSEYPLARAGEALTDLAAGRFKGKIVLTPEPAA